MPTEIERWTIQITGQVRTAQRDFTETLVEIGTLLAKVRAALPHGEWLRWLDPMPFARRSAANYLALAQWANARPRDFLRLKQLGPSKLYAILRLDGRHLRGLQLGRSYRVPGREPGRDQERTLERMSVPELHAFVAEKLGQDPTPAIARVVSSYRIRLAGLLRATVTLVARSGELDRGVLGQLRAALKEVLARLRLRGATLAPANA